MSIEDKIIVEIEQLSESKIYDFDEIIIGQGALLDSFDILHILLFIEMNFSVKIDADTLDINNFNTVNKIVSYIEKNIV